MRIETYLSTTKEDVESKQHNVWIGVSLGNKYFTPEHIEQFILWALRHTREDVLVVIADDIQAINLEVFDKQNYDSSLRRVRRQGDKKLEEVNEISERLPVEDRKKVHVARWQEVINSKYHDYRREVLFDEFKKNKPFHDFILDIIRESRKDRVNELSIDQLERLAAYILEEIPVFINGVKYKVNGTEWRTYSLIIYPGLSKLDELFIGLQNRTLFPEVADRLKITDMIAIVEGYVD